MVGIGIAGCDGCGCEPPLECAGCCDTYASVELTLNGSFSNSCALEYCSSGVPGVCFDHDNITNPDLCGYFSYGAILDKAASGGSHDIGSIIPPFTTCGRDGDGHCFFEHLDETVCFAFEGTWLINVGGTIGDPCCGVIQVRRRVYFNIVQIAGGDCRAVAAIVFNHTYTGFCGDPCYGVGLDRIVYYLYESDVLSSNPEDCCESVVLDYKCRYGAGAGEEIMCDSHPTSITATFTCE